MIYLIAIFFHPSFSESFSNEGLTFEDLKHGNFQKLSTESSQKLVSKIEKNFMIVKRSTLQFNFLFQITISLLVCFTTDDLLHIRPFLCYSEESSIPTLIHEVGLIDETISLNVNHSLEEELVMKHLKLDPLHLSYPNSSKYFGLTKSKYFMPKLSGSATAHSYYTSNPIDHSLTQSNIDIIIFLSSPDELSGTYHLISQN